VDKNLYMKYVILLIIGCIGAVASIIFGIYIYIKEDLSEYINFEFLKNLTSKKRFIKHKKQSLVAKSNLLAIKDEQSQESVELTSDDTTLLNDDTTLLNDENVNL